MMARRLLQAACAAALLATSAGAAGMSLVEAWELARVHDPLYRAARHAEQAGREHALLGRAALLPSLSGSYTASRNRADIVSGARTTHPAYHAHAGSVSLRQALFNLDAWARYRQGQAQSAGSAARLEADGQALILRVAGAYIDAVFSDDQLALAQAARDLLAEQGRASARLFEQGEGTRTELLETQARLDLAEARLLEAADAQRAARATLAAITGADLEAARLEQLPEDYRAPPAPGGFDQWCAQALADNPERRAQRFGVAAAEAEAQRARAAHLPRLDFVASYAKNDSETINTLDQESTVRSVGLQLNVPLFAGGATSAGARQAQANLLRAGAELDDQTGKLLLELRKDYDALASGAARIAALHKAVASARLLVHATGQSIKGGVRIQLDLLGAQEQLYTARRDLSQARYGYLLAALRLRAGAGALSGQDLREIGQQMRGQPLRGQQMGSAPGGAQLP